jgi:flavin reductase (DIM6/NTAB) family NADH-FMN oxidoreductase RutF
MTKPGEVAHAFDALVADLDAPMLIVTTRAGVEIAGCLVGFSTQSSIHPRRFIACVSKRNHTYRIALHARALGVHVVPADAMALAEVFGGETADEVDKFAQVAWHDGPEGVPRVEACRDWFVGLILDRLDVGDHCAFLLEPVAASHEGHTEAMRLHQAHHIAPGHPA